MSPDLAPGNPMARPLASVVGFEVIVIGLAIPGMILVSDVATPTATVVGVVGMVLSAVATVLVARRDSYLVGWLTQLYAVAMGLATPMMYLVGAIFAVIWVASFVLGRRLESAGSAPPRR